MVKVLFCERNCIELLTDCKKKPSLVKHRHDTSTKETSHVRIQELKLRIEGV